MFAFALELEAFSRLRGGSSTRTELSLLAPKSGSSTSSQSRGFELWIEPLAGATFVLELTDGS